LKIKGRELTDGIEPIMIAEEGQANQGDLRIALDVARIAKESKADGIEYQLFTADEMYAAGSSGYELYKSCEFNRNEIVELIEETRNLGLIIQIAGLSSSVIDLCAKNDVDIFVINATDLNNPQIIDAVIETGIPFWLATLMGTYREIDWAVEYCISKGAKEFGLLHGQHVMSSQGNPGVPFKYLQLDSIRDMNARYGLSVGFVDHTATKFVPSLAAYKGASLITKHLAPYSGWTGPDFEVCLDPASWREAREILSHSYAALGSSKELSLEEIVDRESFGRSLHATRDLKSGLVIEKSDLIALRPGPGGIEPSLINTLVGKKVGTDIKKGQQLTYDLIAESDRNQ
jgi:sialic acid synthase SpsE